MPKTSRTKQTSDGELKVLRQIKMAGISTKYVSIPAKMMRHLGWSDDDYLLIETNLKQKCLMIRKLTIEALGQ